MSAYLKGVEYGNMTDAVTDALREEILSGSIEPNTWLREQDIAHRLGVSRTPVREAIRRLSDEGLTRRTANQGALVTPMSVDDMLAVYAVRGSLEGLAARTAAAKQPDGLVDELSAIQDQMVRTLDDPKRLAELNLDFHRILRDASRNPYLSRFLTQVERATRRFGGTSYEIPGRAQDAVAEHYAIIAAIASGAPDAAESSAMEHTRRARDGRLSQILEQRFKYQPTTPIESGEPTAS